MTTAAVIYATAALVAIRSATPFEKLASEKILRLSPQVKAEATGIGLRLVHPYRANDAHDAEYAGHNLARNGGKPSVETAGKCGPEHLADGIGLQRDSRRQE